MEHRVETMSLEEKAGQLFTFYYCNQNYAEAAEMCIKQLKAGGMFLDVQSLDNPEQVHELTGRMQETALQEGSGIPLFIAADFVAGAGCKLPGGGAVHFPKNMAIGAAGDERLAYESGRITAEESLAMGVNFNYSPVVDINNNPDNPVIGTHSFGETRELVATMGTAVIRGYQEHGMIATAKHFPGHGDTNVDSHLALPVLPFDEERLRQFELSTFREAIRCGVDAIMVGHIAVPALDPSMFPASLSKPMVTGLLRQEMGFHGLIVTDGMSMKGVTSLYSQARACVLALAAGADIVLAHPREDREAVEMVDAVLEAVRSGELEEARIDESVRRILAVKEKYGLTPERAATAAGAMKTTLLNQPASREISLQLAAQVMSPIGEAGRWEQVKGVRAEGTQWNLIAHSSLTLFADRLEKSGAIASKRLVDANERLSQAAGEWASEGPLLVAIAHNKRLPDEVYEQLRALAASSAHDVVAVHFGSPYDVREWPELPVLLMYDHAPALQETAAQFFTS
ncbi:hypothetical protein M6D81_26465 [Paenibacillus sp. J5C_2022]|uniref:glycoside hydrolase family 3 protein n=1 Tax=Paenibacillus sp. J5C2022 TaxID=2977129 RepID=UPI0021CF2F16|nr:glycoside hydrolase family 3 N-terminal domain-containing protein [Paenibacillus sp. J5C2022]MCU6712250.1 hypothetical protein [Paenibacillus sp. J5C2022]